MKTDIPQDKFPIKLTPHVWMLGNYFFNLFLVTGHNRSALFEVGVSGVVDAVISQLEFLEISPDYLIPSHPHSDHVTGVPGLAERFPKAQILLAEGAREFITHPKAGPLMVIEDNFMSKSLEERGIKPGRPPLAAAFDIPQAQVVAERRCLDLGGDVSLDLLPVAGHSPGNLMGYVQQDKILFCSDSLGFHFPGRRFWPLFFTSARGYLSTIDLIQSLNPEIICPAHQGPLSSVSQGIQDGRDIAISTIQRIKETRLSDEDLAQEMFEQSYVDEFTLYTAENLQNCARLLIKRARET